MAGKKELFEAASAEPRVAALAGDGRPAFLFDRSGTAILWANAAGLSYFGASDLADLLGRSFQPAAPFARRVSQLSGQLASGQQRTERIALPKGLLPQPVVCRAERVVVIGEKTVLLVVVDGTGRIDTAEAARRAAALAPPFADALPLDLPAQVTQKVAPFEISASEPDPVAASPEIDAVHEAATEPVVEIAALGADAFDAPPAGSDTGVQIEAADAATPDASATEIGDFEQAFVAEDAPESDAVSADVETPPHLPEADPAEAGEMAEGFATTADDATADLPTDPQPSDVRTAVAVAPDDAILAELEETVPIEDPDALETESAADDLVDLRRLDGILSNAAAEAAWQEPLEGSAAEQTPIDDETADEEAHPIRVEGDDVDPTLASEGPETGVAVTEPVEADASESELAGTAGPVVMDTPADTGPAPSETDQEAELVEVSAEPPIEDETGTLSHDDQPSASDGPDALETSGFVPPSHGRSVRFVFELDPELVVSFVSPELAEIVGPLAADIVDFSWSEVAGRLMLDPNGRVTTALGQRDTFTGLTVDWPVQDQPLRVPVSLAGMPVFGRDRSFRGYRGFGIAHSGAAFSAEAVIGTSTPAPQARLGADALPAAAPESIGDASFDDASQIAPDVAAAAMLPPDLPDGGPEPVPEEEAPAIVSDIEPEVVRDEASTVEVPTPLEMVEDGLGSEWGAVPEDVAPDGPDSSTLSPNEVEPRPETTPDSPKPDDVPATEPLPELPPAETPAGEPRTPSEYPDEPQPEYPAPGPDMLPPAPDHVPDEAPQPLPEEAPVISPDDTPSTLPDESPAGLPEEAPDLAPMDIPLDLPPEVSAWAYSAAKAAALAEQEHFARMGIAPTIGGVTDDIGTTISAGIADLSEAVIADTRLEDLLPEYEPAASPKDGGDLPENTTDLPPPFDDGDLPESAPPSQDDLMWRDPPRGEVIASPIVARPIPKDETTFSADDRRMLSKPEREAFQKIAEALGARLDDGTGPNMFGALPVGALQIDDAVSASPEESEDDVLTDMAVAPKPAVRVVLPKLDACLLDKLPIPLAILKNGEAVMVNRAFLDLTGYDDLAQLAAAGGFAEAFAGSALPRDTSAPAIRRRDGVEVPVKARLHSMPFEDGIASLMVLQEVAETTGRTRAEQAEARVEELEAILDTATDGVLVLDGEGTILGANKSAEALFGAPRAAMVGQPIVDLLAPESHRGALDYLDGLTRNGLSSVLNDGREVIGRVAQGGLVPLFMTIGRVSAQKFCAVLRDITQWKRAEEELTNAKRSAENASSQKSDFLAKISHEIRTPLNAIIGFSEVMMEERFGPVGNDRYKEYLRDIHMSGAHIMSLVNDLLDLSKIEAGKLDLSFEAVALNEVVRECVALMQPQANRERIIIRTSLSSTLPNVVADSRSLRQIVLNLLSNALKFNSAGGQVIVSTLYEETGEVAFRVRDTGPGMSEEDVMKALEPFRQLQTTRPGRGTGLGLPLTKALVEANRAAFRIDSAPGQGTLVQVTFPSTRVLAE